MRINTKFLIFFLFHFILFSQENNIVKNYYKENFVVRAFAFSKQHYFGRLSYNNQTIYTINMLHPNKSMIIFSNTNKGVKTFDFSSDERFLIAGTNSGNLEVWDIDKRTLFKSISLHNKEINKVNVLSGKSSFISAGNDGKIFLVDYKESQKSKIIGSHDGIVRDFDLSDKENLLVSIGSDDKLVLWSLKEFKRIKSVIIPDITPSSVKFIPNSNTLLVGSTEGTLLWFDDKLNLKKKLKIHDNLITSICPLSESIFITGSFDGTVKKVSLPSFYAEELYSNKSYIIKIAINNNRLMFSKRNGELISIKIKP